MKTTLEKWQPDKERSIANFAEAVNRGIEAWAEAGSILVQMMAKDEDLFNKILSAHPEIGMDMLLTFERIGRKQIFAPLLAMNCPASEHLLELPYEVQERCTREPVEIVVKHGENYKITSKRLHELTKKESELAFNHEGTRPTDRQLKILQIKAAEKIIPAPVTPVKKPESLGFFTIHIDTDGEPRITRGTNNNRPYYTRLTAVGRGGEVVIEIFKASS